MKMTAAIYLLGDENRYYTEVRIIVHQAAFFESERLDQNRRKTKSCVCFDSETKFDSVTAVSILVKRAFRAICRIVGKEKAQKLLAEAEKLLGNTNKAESA